MPPYRLRVLASAPLAASVCALAAFAAPAGAAAITTAPCVVDYGPGVSSMAIAGNAFTPGGTVNIATNSSAKPTPAPLASSAVNSLGGFSGTTEPPAFNRASTNEQTFNLLASDGANSAITQFRQVRFGGAVKPRNGSPRGKVRYRVRGFTPGRNIYIHYRFKGKTRKNVKLGKAKSPCGKATRKLRRLPTRVRYGLWRIYIDQEPKYSKNTVFVLKTTLNIYRIFR